MKKILKVLLVILLSLIGLIIFIGSFSPETNEADITQIFETSANQIYSLWTDLDTLPKRRLLLNEVTYIGLNEFNLQMWREGFFPTGHINKEYLEVRTNESLEIYMSESTFGITGTWTYELAESELGFVSVKITENSQASNLFTRGMLTILGRNIILKNEFQLIEKDLKNL